MARLSASRPGRTWQWMRNVVPARTIDPTSIGRPGGHGSGPGCGPNPRSRSIAAPARTPAGGRAAGRGTAPHRARGRHVVRRRGDGQVDDALARQTWYRGAADVLDDQIGAMLVDQLGDRLGDLDGSGIPRLESGRPSLIW